MSNQKWLGPTKAAEGMHPDLEWLARNVREWPHGEYSVFVDRDGEVMFSPNASADFYPEPRPPEEVRTVVRWGHSQWLFARKDLGLEGQGMKRGKTEAETLALNGWKVGDILEGDEGNGPDRILITAIGEDRFTAKWDYKCTGEYDRESGNVTLSCREWRKVGHRAGLGTVCATPEQEADWHKEEGLRKVEYSPYFKDVRHIDTLDVYRVIDLFGCEKHGHPISHAVKKLLLSGVRTGGKDVEKDVDEAIDSLIRWKEMREEDRRATS